MAIINKILKAYDQSSFVIKLKARFVFFSYIIVLTGILFAVFYTMYANLNNPLYHYSINFSIILLYLGTFVILSLGLLLILRGYFNYAAHFLLVCGLSLVWITIFIDKTHVVSRLDSIVLIAALLSMLPIVISKRPASMLFYAVANIAVLYLFVYFFRHELNLPKASVISYLSDNTVAIFAITVIAYEVFSINKRAMDKAELDFAERIKAEEALKISELFKMRVFDSSKIPIVVMDSNLYQFIEFNQAAIDAYGYISREALLGKSPVDVSAKVQYDGTPSAEKASTYIDKALAHGTVFFEWKHQRPNGELWDAEIHLLSFEANEKKFFQFSIIDTTEKKNAELALKAYRDHLEELVNQRTNELANINEELLISNNELLDQRETLETTLKDLKTAQSQLIQAEKMASLGVLAAGVAHEINNPLNYIYNGTKAIEDHIKDKYSEDTEYLNPLLDAIGTGVDRITGIVKSMNRYCRKEDLPYMDCNLQEVMNDCLILLHDKYRNRIDIKKNYLPESPLYFANEGQLHQAFLNILANAIQAIENEGTITIDVTLNNQQIVVSINDNGKGISKENLKYIFDPFFTTKNPGDGTGLGLAITKKIIEEHGGTILCNSALYEGTTFIIGFPLKKE